MAQSASSEVVPLPKRRLTLEFVVGIFTILSVLAAGYLAVGLGGLDLSGKGRYSLYAEFDNVSGLKYGASVELAGVKVGDVSNIELKDSLAVLTLRINDGFEIYDDDILAIRTKGIIGDRFVKISRGGAGEVVPANETVIETESVVDFEDIIGKIVHSLSSDDDE